MDPISNMLIMIKNAGKTSKESVIIPYSNPKNAIAKCLLREGYVKSVDKKTKKGFPVLEIGIERKGNTPRITDLKRISKPSRRIYMGVREIRPVRNGFGVLVLSTPKGIMTDTQARKEHVGGEALFSIW